MLTSELLYIAATTCELLNSFADPEIGRFVSSTQTPGVLFCRGFFARLKCRGLNVFNLSDKVSHRRQLEVLFLRGKCNGVLLQ